MTRPEITGQKPGAGNVDFIEGNEPPPLPRLAMSIEQFCKAHNISEEMFYKIGRQGKGPRLMRVGTRKLVSMESAAGWRRDCEQVRANEDAAKAIKSEPRRPQIKTKRSAQREQVNA